MCVVQYVASVIIAVTQVQKNLYCACIYDSLNTNQNYVKHTMVILNLLIDVRLFPIICCCFASNNPIFLNVFF